MQRTRPFRHFFGLVFCAALVGSLAGCAYRAGFRLPEGYHSYGVEIFANSSLEPDIERPLHTYLTRALSDSAGARLVAPKSAEAFVRGRILSTDRRAGIRNRDNQWLESGNRVVIQAELVDAQRGEVLASSQVFVEVGFVFQVHGGESQAREYALENAAERLVLELLQKVDADGPGAQMHLPAEEGSVPK